MKGAFNLLIFIAFVATQVSCQGKSNGEPVIAAIKEVENATEDELEVITDELEKEAGEMQHTVDEIRKTVNVVLKQNVVEGEPVTKTTRRRIIVSTRRRIKRLEDRIKDFRTRLRFIRKNDLERWYDTMRGLTKEQKVIRSESIRERIGIFRSKIVSFRERGFGFRRQIRRLRQNLRTLRRRPIIRE